MIRSKTVACGLHRSRDWGISNHGSSDAFGIHNTMPNPNPSAAEKLRYV